MCMQVGACLSPTETFQPISFVNGVATTRGGTHVAHVSAPLLAGVAPMLTKALKLPADDELTPARLKPHLMLFVHATVNNPEFDSQAKEALTTPPHDYGGLCDLPRSLLSRVASLDGLQSAVGDAARRRMARQLSRRVGGRSATLDLPKLEDAELAGGARGSEGTLIITEGRAWPRSRAPMY
jgi:DNA topoisomerase-2